MAATIEEPWVMMGDFNKIANPNEKKEECRWTLENVRILTIESITVG